MAYTYVENWMSEIKDDTFLAEMTIPGTHDSAAKGSIVPFVNCQEYDIRDQLRFGVRYLDIRLQLEDGRLRCYHGDYKLGLYFSDVVAACRNLFSYGPEETIIMSIKDEGESAGFDKAVKASLSDANLWWTGNTVPNLGQVRGRIVVVRRWSSSTDFGIDATAWNGRDDPTFNISIPPYTMVIQDCWKGPAFGEKWSYVKKWLSRASTSRSDDRSWYLNFLSATDPWPPYLIGPESFALGYRAGVPPFPWVEGMNPRLKSYLDSVSAQAQRYGTVVLDYVGKGPYESIIPSLIRNNRMYEKSLWSNWAVGNANGFSNPKSYSPLRINAMRGIEQSGYGLINLQLGFLLPDQTQGWLEWNSQNHGDDSTVTIPVTVPIGQNATGIQVWNQSGFGLVDACLIYGQGAQTPRLTNNNGGSAVSPVLIPAAEQFLGFQTQEQWGYGLIDLRVFGVARPLA